MKLVSGNVASWQKCCLRTAASRNLRCMQDAAHLSSSLSSSPLLSLSLTSSPLLSLSLTNPLPLLHRGLRVLARHGVSRAFVRQSSLPVSTSLGGAPKTCITFVTGRRLHTSLERELLGSNGKTHRIWNGGLPPDRLPMSFFIRPQ